MSDADPAVEHVCREAVAFASSNGIVMGIRGQEPAVVHAPVTLKPTPFPASEIAAAEALSTVFNALVESIAQDVDWLHTTLAPAAEADDFTRRLLELHRAVLSRGGPVQPARLAVTRSDYMLDAPSGRLLQVELNTIASSFAALSTGITDMHRYLLDRHGRSYAAAAALRLAHAEGGVPSRSELAHQLPANKALSVISQALLRAHRHYVSAHCSGAAEPHPRAVVVAFVVQPGETNAADQRQLERALYGEGVGVRRLTLLDIARRGEAGEQRQLVVDGEEISLLYYRAGYTPNDYPSEEEWEGRRLGELSLAIKCPSVEYHLVGAKKVQQALCAPGAVERFIPDAAQAQALRRVFAGQWALGPGADAEAQAAAADAIANPSRYVLKPQREGGGNNLYGPALARALTELPDTELQAFVLMQRIFPPKLPNVLMRQGRAVAGDTVSELGVYGGVLAVAGAVVWNQGGGTLLRTKLDGVDEGGVATGFSCLDTPLRV